MQEGATVVREVKGYVYSDKPVEAVIGNNRIRFPANYYNDQMGPHPGGGVAIKLMWPDFKPARPGARKEWTRDDNYRAITIQIDALREERPAELLEDLIDLHKRRSPNPREPQDPSDILEMRIRLPEEHGLTPYIIDQDKLDVYDQQTGNRLNRGGSWEVDWYIHRTDGRIDTLIECGSRLHQGDGFKVVNGGLVFDGSHRVALCDHYALDVAKGLAFRIYYPRAYIGDWRRIESAVRAAVEEYRSGDERPRAQEEA